MITTKTKTAKLIITETGEKIEKKLGEQSLECINNVNCAARL